MSAKGDKPVFAKYIFKHIRVLDPPGRFLKKNGEHWEDMGDKKALDKTRQALREDADKVKNEIESGKQKVKTVSYNDYNCQGTLHARKVDSDSWKILGIVKN